MKSCLKGLVVLALGIFLVWLAGPSQLRSQGDMADPRSEVHAAELNGVIFVTGGIGFFRTLNSCAAFDAAKEEITPCPNLPRSLHHVAMASGEGQVFASGGYSSLPFNIDTDGAIFALKPSSPNAQWIEIARLPQPLGQHAMFYHSGSLWLVGGDRRGETTNALLRYDLEGENWEKMAHMPTPRHSHAIAFDDGKLFVTGGRSNALGNQSRIVEAYDVASGSWETLPDLPFDLAGHGAAITDERLHVFGGESLDAGTVFQRHVTLDLTDHDAGWKDAEPMTFARHGFATAKVGEVAWILGGGKRAGLRTPWSVTGSVFPLPLR